MRRIFSSSKPAEASEAYKRERQSEEVRRQHQRWSYGSPQSGHPIFPLR